MKRWKRILRSDPHRSLLVNAPLVMEIRSVHLAWGFRPWKIDRSALGFYLFAYEMKDRVVHENLIRDEINTLKGKEKHGRFE